MNLFEFKDNNNFEITFSPQLLTIPIFKKIVDRDKSKGKDVAIKEISFVGFVADMKSDYMYILDESTRKTQVAKDLELGSKWKPDDIIEEAIVFYKDHSKTVNSSMYEAALMAADAINEVCKNAKTHIGEADDILAATQKVTAILEKIPKTMANLNSAYIELIKEQKITEGRSKGSKEFNMFEDGLNYEDE
jgi:hypothetical protein